MKKIIVTIGTFILDPIKKIGLSRATDGVVNFSNKNPWLKVLMTFIVVITLVLLYYVFDQKMIF